MNWLRIKIVNGLLRVTAWLMGLPSPSGGGGPAPSINAFVETPAPAPEPDQAEDEPDRYFISYTFTCAWPHHNSPIRVPGGFVDSVIRVNKPMSAERVDAIRNYMNHSLSKAGVKNPIATILCMTKLN